MLLKNEDIVVVEMEFMNEVHYEDVKIINDLFELILRYENNNNDDIYNKINSQYEIWFEHTINHFKGEEDMMFEKKFPPYPIHKAEHDNALSNMQDVFLIWKNSKNIKLLKKYVSIEIPQWLSQHIGTLDFITAGFLKNGNMSCHA